MLKVQYSAHQDMRAHDRAGMQVDANLALVGFDAERDFDAIVSADLFERLKPAPDIFLAAAEQARPTSLNTDMRPLSYRPQIRVHIVQG